MRTVCLAEESPELLEELTAWLEDRGCTVHAFDDATEAWAHLLTSSSDILLASQELPGMSGLDLLTRIRDADLRTSTILLTRDGSEDLAVEALHLGASGYLVKGAFHEIQRPLARAFARASERLDREETMRRRLVDLRERNRRLRAEVTERTAELRRSNEELQGLDRMKTEFITLMSHEIRTPLTSILGFSELLSLGICEDPGEQRAVAEQVHAAGRTLQHFVDDVMELFASMTGQQELSLRPVRLDRAIGSALDLTAESILSKEVTIRVDADDRTMAIADEAVLVGALHRVIDNAVKFSDSNGTIEVRVSPGDGVAVIEIEDHGVGIAPDKQEQIFRPFEIAGEIAHHSTGRGLGMALVRQSLERLGGAVVVDSEGIGHGSTVRMTIPGLCKRVTAEEGDAAAVPVEDRS